MDKLGIAIGDQSGGENLKIAADRRIGVLADNQRRTRVLQEDVTQATVDSRPTNDLLDGP